MHGLNDFFNLNLPQSEVTFHYGQHISKNN